MNTQSLLEHFGYLAVFIGTFLEGETSVIAAGFFASRGHFTYGGVVTVAAIGAYAGHVFWFWLGRMHGVRLLDRYPKLNRHLGKGIRVFERYGASAIIITQWIYGLRITCAVIIGMSKISVGKYLLYEGVTCIAWSFVFTTAGYYFGRAIESLLGRIDHLELYVIAFIAVAAGILWIRHRRKEREECDEANTEH